jgi:hypothetical protein
MNPDATLENRLITLEEDLSTVLSGLEKLQSDLEGIGADGSSDEGVRRDLRAKVKTFQTTIGKLRTNLSATPGGDAWVQYGKLRDQGNQLYGEFLDIVGGVVIRSREIDEKICLIAEGLVRPAGHPPSLTILASRDSYVPNLARLMRVRVSDRTIWCLPLTAHQFARVLIKDYEDLGDFARKQAEAEVAKDFPELLAPNPDPAVQKRNPARRKKLENAAASRWEQLIADCLALNIVGPCYAASALLCRLSPVAGLPDDETQAEDIERAFICLEMLRKMDAGAIDTVNPYTEFISWLDKLWTQTLTDAGSSNALSPETQAVLTAFVKGLYDLMDQVLPGVQYPAVEDQYAPDLGGWHVATQWYKMWCLARTRKPPVPLELPKTITSASKVRDALNAGWLYRSTFDAGMQEVTKIMRDLCDAILAKWSKREGPGSVSAAAQGPKSETRA